MVLVFFVGLNALVQKKKELGWFKNLVVCHCRKSGSTRAWFTTVTNCENLKPLNSFFVFVFVFVFFFCSFFFLLNMSKTYSIKYQRHIQTLVKYVRWNFLWKAVKQLTVTSFSKSSILVVSQGFKYASEQKDIEHSIVVFLYNAF